MKFFVKCLAVYIALTVIIMLVNVYVLNVQIVLSGNFLVSAFFGLLGTILFGWIDAVYVQKRQPGLEK